MCGRYGLVPGKNFYDRYEIENRNGEIPSNEQAAPGAMMPVVIKAGENNKGRVGVMKWGMGYYNSFNARCEDIDKKPSFRQAFRTGRCLVPANGFYEWKKISDAGKPVKVPYWISLKDKNILSMAGIYEDGNFCIVTTQPNAMVSQIHNRMPVIVSQRDEKVWMDNDKYDPEVLKKIMRPYADNEMEMIKITAATWQKSIR